MTTATILPSLTATATIEPEFTATATINKTDGVRDIPVVAGGGLISSATVDRNSTATYFDADGTLQTAAIDEARTTYIGGVPLLLMEGMRTNVIKQSKDFGAANWVKSASGTGSDPVVTVNAETAPDGNDTADKVVFDSGAGTTSSDWSLLNQSPGGTITGSATHTLSIWLKGNAGGEEVVVRHVGKTAFTKFTLTDSWVRYTVSETPLDTSPFAEIGIRQSVSGLGVINSTATVYMWGVQVEEGEHESSYIKTTTAAVSRAADSASLANSIIAGLTEGTIYAEVYSEHLTSEDARHIAELESDANNFIRAFIAADGDIDGQITSGGVSQAALAGPAHTPDTLHKVALVFGPSGFALYVDGTQEATGTGTVPSVDTLLIGAGLYGGIRNMNVHPDEWSQAKAEAETT